MKYAPIILFVYNRPWHTRQTVASLLHNKIAAESELIIYSDGPKGAKDNGHVHNVRTYIHDLHGFKKIQIYENKRNIGLAESIVTGVTETVNKYGRVIVLEDDMVTSPAFLQFMNDALAFYHSYKKVMHISGYMYPISSEGLTETFFLRPASCWGWATWDRAWKYYEKDIDRYYDIFTPTMINRFNLDGSYNYWSQIEKNKKGKINTWAIFWYASIFLKRGLCLHPSVSMVNNIGHDGSGQHCTKTDKFQTAIADVPLQKFPSDIIEDAEALERLKRFFDCSGRNPFRNLFLRGSKALKMMTTRQRIG